MQAFLFLAVLIPLVEHSLFPMDAGQRLPISITSKHMHWCSDSSVVKEGNPASRLTTYIIMFLCFPRLPFLLDWFLSLFTVVLRDSYPFLGLLSLKMPLKRVASPTCFSFIKT